MSGSTDPRRPPGRPQQTQSNGKCEKRNAEGSPEGRPASKKVVTSSAVASRPGLSNPEDPRRVNKNDPRLQNRSGSSTPLNNARDQSPRESLASRIHAQLQEFSKLTAKVAAFKVASDQAESLKNRAKQEMDAAKSEAKYYPSIWDLKRKKHESAKAEYDRVRNHLASCEENQQPIIKDLAVIIGNVQKDASAQANSAATTTAAAYQDMKGEVLSLRKEMQDLQSALAEIKSSVSDVTTKEASRKAELDKSLLLYKSSAEKDLQTRLTPLSDMLQELKAELEAVAKKLAALQHDVETVNKNVTKVDEKLGRELKTLKSGVDQKLDSTQATQKNNSNMLSKLEQRLQKIESDSMSNVPESIPEANEKRFKSLDTDIKNLRTDIHGATALSKTHELERQIGDLSKKLDKLEKRTTSVRGLPNGTTPTPPPVVGAQFVPIPPAVRSPMTNFPADAVGVLQSLDQRTGALENVMRALTQRVDNAVTDQLAPQIADRLQRTWPSAAALGQQVSEVRNVLGEALKKISDLEVNTIVDHHLLEVNEQKTRENEERLAENAKEVEDSKKHLAEAARAVQDLQSTIIALKTRIDEEQRQRVLDDVAGRETSVAPENDDDVDDDDDDDDEMDDDDS